MRLLVIVALGLGVLWPCEGATQAFTNFESGHVRPLAMSPDGSRLFAVNTPDNRLTIYGIGAGTLTLQAEVTVGLEPVAVAARSNGEVWVVNHLSDSVSVVQIDTVTPAQSRVIRTLHTCDEPRDIVFAGPGGTRAFVTTARRGQNCPVTVTPDLTMAGRPRAIVQVWDATSLGAALGGSPIANIELFTDTPRALAKNADGTRVYAAGFHSGNRTTAIAQSVVSGNAQGLPPDPAESVYALPKPPVGLIVKFNGTTWKDERPGSNWNSAVPFSLPDRDVFAIDTATLALAAGPNTTVGAGTIIFNMAVRPNATGQLYVANVDARNEVRFEPRIPSTGGGVQGHIVESRITVVNGVTPTPHHLNPHIDYTCVPPGCPNDAAEIEQSLAFPMDLQFSSDGARLYVVGFGSEKVGILDAAQLEGGVITGTTKHLVTVGGGPSGLALDEAHDQLFVMNRFDGTISIVANAGNPATAAQVTVVALRYDPSPAAAYVGRRFLYDARRTSAHGDNACASCHIFGDFDSLAWDLSNPLDPAEPVNGNPFRLRPPGSNLADFSTGGDGVGIPCVGCTFHPMKGPMTTQTLRGMAGAGPMHWRGDRTGATSAQDPLDEGLAFKAFNPAFVGLLGHDTQLSVTDLQAYTDFILSVALPPSPIRDLSDALNSASFSESAGSTFFNNTAVDGGLIQCVQCHRNPLGTDGLSSFEGEPQEFKIAHLRNIYQKVGMFAAAGDQVRGFGFLHDGSVATVFDFLHASVFNFGNSPDTKRRNVEAFMLAFDSGQAPAVGQQVTVTPGTVNDMDVMNRIDLLIARDDAARCDLTVKGAIAGAARGWVYVGSNTFQPDRNADAVISKTALRTLAATVGQELTYTCVPLGSGTRIGVDRDLDGTYDRRELDCGSDPANAASLAPPTGACGGATTSTSTSTSSTSSSTSTSTSSSTSTSRSTTTSTSTAVPTTVTTASSSSSSSSSSSTSSSTSTTHTTAPTTSSTSSSTTTSTSSSTATSSSSSSSSSSTSSTTSPTTTSGAPGSSTSSTTSTLPMIRIQSTALTLRDRSQVPADPNRRKIAFKATTIGDAASNQIVVPARGSSADPTATGGNGGGAVVQVYNANGSGETVTVALPASGWAALDDAATPRGYKFKSAVSTDPITRVVVRGNLLRVRGGRSGWGYTLDEASQGRVAVRVTMGSALQWCAESPAKASGNPPSSAPYDRIDKFVGARRSPAPAVCPAVP